MVTFVDVQASPLPALAGKGVDVTREYDKRAMLTAAMSLNFFKSLHL
jgi:hypothetical protein